jgi:hypothetical protein
VRWGRNSEGFRKRVCTAVGVWCAGHFPFFGGVEAVLYVYG